MQEGSEHSMGNESSAFTMDRSEFYESPDGAKIYGPCLDGVRHIPYERSIEKVKNMPKYPIDDSDIIVSSFPKSGTNWVMNIIKMIMYKDILKDNREYNLPENLFLEKIDTNINETFTEPRRVFATHTLPRGLPDDIVHGGKGTLIYVKRNPKDAIVSFYHFMKEYIKFEGSFLSFFNMFMDGQWYYGDWFNYVMAYHVFVEKNKHRCLVVTFEDLKREPHKGVRQIAKHIGYEISDVDIDLVLDLCCIDKMRTRMSQLDDANIRPYRVAFYRKGEVGDWKNYFTVAMSERFNAEYDRRLRPAGLISLFDLD